MSTEREAAPSLPLFFPQHFAGVPDRWVAPIASILGGVLGAPALQQLVESAADRGGVSEWARAIIDTLNIRVRLRGECLQKQIASSGPLVIAANHPFGILDGLLSMAQLPPLRPDLRYLGQQLWHGMPNVGPVLFPLQPTTGHRFEDLNARSLRAAINWVRNGHALALFPAPRVATWCWARRGVVDPPWSNLIGVLVARARADVLPVHIAGGNSVLFQAAAALLHPVHHALLIREFLNKKNRTIQITIGERLTRDSLGCGTDVPRVTERIRGIVERLGTEGHRSSDRAS